MSAGNNTSNGAPSLLDNEFFELLDKLQVARFSLFSFVFVLGIWGNVMVIGTICTTKRLRSSSNYFIANLAVADLCSLCISMPIAVIGQVTNWPFGEIVCRFFNPLKDLFSNVCFITLTVIAIDRYVHIAYPFKPHITIYKVKLIISLIWLVNYLVVPLPMGFAMKIERNPISGFDVCMIEMSPEWQKIAILALAGFLLLSVLVTALAYLGVGIVMFRQRARIKKRAQESGLHDKSHRRQLEKNAKTVKLMIVIVLAAWLNVLPLTLFGMLLELEVLVLTHTEYAIFLFIAMHLLFLQHCINPIILYVLSKEMRAGFAACVQCCCGGKQLKRNASQRRASTTSQRRVSTTQNKAHQRRPSKTHNTNHSSATKPAQLAENGFAKMYHINNNNERGPVVQV